MELTYKELQKRDVINVVDGKCLGRITDMKFRFPEGKIEGIVVPGKRVCALFSIFNKSSLYIPEKNIIKIGGDVILVDLSCGDTCEDYVNINKGEKSKKPCPPSCVPQCPPPCPPDRPDFNRESSGDEINFDEY